MAIRFANNSVGVNMPTSFIISCNGSATYTQSFDVSKCGKIHIDNITINGKDNRKKHIKFVSGNITLYSLEQSNGKEVTVNDVEIDVSAYDEVTMELYTSQSSSIPYSIKVTNMVQR